MKLRLTFFLCLLSLAARPCGWSYDSDHYFYHNLFDQTNISSEAFYPFLRDDFNPFYEGDEKPYQQGNLALWKEVLQNWSSEEIEKAVFSASEAEFEQYWTHKKSPLELSSKAYLKLARKCSQAFAHRVAHSWDYEEIRQEVPVDVPSLLEEATLLFNAENHQQLKMRYGYQIVRILHYSKQYKEALAFFTEQLEPLSQKNEIYYYTLDQLAGCYYSLEAYEKAAQLFLHVFNHSTDRKKSAFRSYQFCTNQGAEGKAYFQGKEDQAAFLLMQGLRSFSDGLAVLHDLSALDSANEKVELMFVRELNNVERELLPKQLGMGEGSLPMKNTEWHRNLDALYDFSKAQQAHASVSNKGFWKLSESYLLFLKGEAALAKQALAQVNSLHYKGQVNTLKQVYEVYGWKEIGPEQESYLAGILNDVITAKEPLAQDSQDSRALILDLLGHLYYKKGQLAKAFLVQNRLEQLERVGSPELIDDLLAFIALPDKNPLEKILMRRTQGSSHAQGAKAYLQLVKGHYYLLQGEPHLALPLLQQATKNEATIARYQTELNNEVSARIFSNNIKECFDCPEEEVMVDSVYLSDAFSFIKPRFSRAGLANNLLSLDSLSRQGISWKRKLAHYLLANYYFNVSNTGYFKNVLPGYASNCCIYRYFPYTSKGYQDAASRIAHHAGYNLSDIDQHDRTYHRLADRAMHHYQQVLALSRDAELNARCLYMMAKCELNGYYNKDLQGSSHHYKGTMDGGAGNYKKSFARLQGEYRQTKFYSMIIRECSFFSMYSSL